MELDGGTPQHREWDLTSGPSVAKKTGREAPLRKDMEGMRKQARNMRGIAMRGLLLTAALLLTVAGASAQICDPEDIPELTVFEDELTLPDPVWSLTPFYPVDGTYIEQIEETLSLDTWFPYFGIPAEQDDGDEWPAHYFLPEGWRSREMVTFEWTRPAGSQIVREPILRSGAVWIQDPAFGSMPDDTMSISPRLQVHGDYTGNRDQRFTFEYSFGARFIGDLVASEMDPGLDAWDISTYSINDTLWYEYPGYEMAVGDTLLIESTVSWKESWGPDEEYGWAPGDTPLDGKIFLYSLYYRGAVDTIELLDTNLHCAHGLFPDDWYPDGNYDPEVDPSAYGLHVSFTPGVFEDNFRWNLVVEEFEGYQVWRRVIGGSQGWVNIWKISRNEERDKFYWWVPMASGQSIVIAPIFGATDERVFLDFDVHNGFEYAYAITTFDRGFRPNSGEGDHYILSSTPVEELDGESQVLVFNRPAGEQLAGELYAVPNPLRTGKSGYDDPNYHNFPGNVVRFVGVTASTTLKVYTVAGDLVHEAENTDPNTSNIVWDTRNQKGELVASGVYVFRAEGQDGDEEFGKLVIIR